jgi:hypothetical protein
MQDLQPPSTGRDRIPFRRLGKPRTNRKKYTLGDRACVYRHAAGTGLDRKRRRDVPAALERIIEHVAEVKVTVGAIVAAIQAYAKINARREWLESDERLYLDDVFDRLWPEEQGEYIETGKLPRWALDELAAAGVQVENEPKE